jgi:hypothetical protein
MSAMDATTIKAMLEQHFEYAHNDPEHAHAMSTEDATLELPPVGRTACRRREHAGMAKQLSGQHIVRVREVRGRDDFWVAELSISYDGGPANFGISILELRGDKVARESIYVAEGFAPPERRAQWRSAP